MELSNFNINNTKVWLSVQPLQCFKKGTLKLTEENGFLCYFNFSAPIFKMEGELILDEKKSPKIFLNKEEIELYAMNYVKRRMNL